jgi:hypothetical protein
LNFCKHYLGQSIYVENKTGSIRTFSLIENPWLARYQFLLISWSNAAKLASDIEPVLRNAIYGIEGFVPRDFFFWSKKA